MAGPIQGLGGQQQVQLSTPQSGQNQVRQQEERQEPRENQVQPQRAPAAQAQNTGTDSQANVAAREQEHIQTADHNNQANNNERERGSLVDISV